MLKGSPWEGAIFKQSPTPLLTAYITLNGAEKFLQNEYSAARLEGRKNSLLISLCFFSHFFFSQFFPPISMFMCFFRPSSKGNYHELQHICSFIYAFFFLIVFYFIVKNTGSGWKLFLINVKCEQLYCSVYTFPANA